MLGSLVIIYPTPHEGGELVLRRKDREWKFDAKSLTASHSSPSLAYVAFHGDIDHEVLKVTSGRKVAIAYNLYLVNTKPDPGASTVVPNPICPSSFQTALRGFLKNPEVLAGGGTLGFGLVRPYLVDSDIELHEMVRFLKGEDANVYNACQELGLEPSLRLIWWDEEHPKYGIMVDKIAVGHYYDSETESYETSLFSDLDGVAVNVAEGAALDDYYRVSEGEGEGEFIEWVSPFSTLNKMRDIAIRSTETGFYGGEQYRENIYFSPCIIVRIAAAIDRV